MILSWRNPTNGRCYQVVLGPDLFGDYVLWRGWCGADGRRGGEMTVAELVPRDRFIDGGLLSVLRRIDRRRRARGYVLLEGGAADGCVQREAATPHEASETDARMDRLGQVGPSDALRERP